MNVNKDYQPAKYVKANKDGSVPTPVASTKKMPKKKGVLNIVLTILGVLLFCGFLNKFRAINAAINNRK